jgi:hypothetical protein
MRGRYRPNRLGELLPPVANEKPQQPRPSSRRRATAGSGRPRTLLQRRTEGLNRHLALMRRGCDTLNVAGRSFTCKTVAYAHGETRRVDFAVAVDDPRRREPRPGENGKPAEDNRTSCRSTVCRSIQRTGRSSAACSAGRAGLNRSLPPTRKLVQER